MSARLTENIAHSRELGQLLIHYAAGKPLLWLGVILSLACAARRWIERERLLLIVVALQTLFYIAAYLVTPLGLAFHVRWSWDRLVWHVQPIIVFIALVTILPLALSWSPTSSTSTSPDA